MGFVVRTEDGQVLDGVYSSVEEAAASAPGQIGIWVLHEPRLESRRRWVVNAQGDPKTVLADGAVIVLRGVDEHGNVVVKPRGFADFVTGGKWVGERKGHTRPFVIEELDLNGEWVQATRFNTQAAD